MKTTRRAAIATMIASPAALAAGGAVAMPAAALDPVFAARDAWKEASRVWCEALRRAQNAGGDQCVTIPTATGGECRALATGEIDQIVNDEANRRSIILTEWMGDIPTSVAALSDAERQAARDWTKPDAGALKADLAERKARLADAMQRENVEALYRAERDAYSAFIDCPATTPAGIAAKLRENDYQENSEVSAALADLDRMAREGAQIATSAPQTAATAGGAA